MSVNERRADIIEQINAIEDEATLSILQEAIGYYATGQKDITDGLSKKDFDELKVIAEEPFDKDTVSEEEFKQIFSRWRTK